MFPRRLTTATTNDTCDAHESAGAARRLVDRIRAMKSCAVAFSGGVDSAVLVKAAYEALGEHALAVTGVGPSFASGELENAREVARQVGIRHRVVETREAELADYQRNDARRCFHCKSHLYGMIAELRGDEHFREILSGTNADDLADYRPGLDAARAFNVRHPLAECGLDKQAVRGLARYWNLSVWDKPAAPCLSSRIAYGVAVTPERLNRIDAAEVYLKSLGLDTLRVRLHEGDLARIEVPTDQLAALISESARTEIIAKFRALGFRFIALDLAGVQSGGLNALLQIAPTQERAKP
jgi:uncharacterized protein